MYNIHKLIHLIKASQCSNTSLLKIATLNKFLYNIAGMVQWLEQSRDKCSIPVPSKMSSAIFPP